MLAVCRALVRGEPPTACRHPGQRPMGKQPASVPSAKPQQLRLPRREAASFNQAVQRMGLRPIADLVVKRDHTMRGRRLKVMRLLACLVGVATASLSPIGRACPIGGPDEKVTLAHFWILSVGNATSVFPNGVAPGTPVPPFLPALTLRYFLGGLN
jgi:hypothetical protein